MENENPTPETTDETPVPLSSVDAMVKLGEAIKGMAESAMSREIQPATPQEAEKIREFFEVSLIMSRACIYVVEQADKSEEETSIAERAMMKFIQDQMDTILAGASPTFLANPRDAIYSIVAMYAQSAFLAGYSYAENGYCLTGAPSDGAFVEFSDGDLETLSNAPLHPPTVERTLQYLGERSCPCPKCTGALPPEVIEAMNSGDSGIRFVTSDQLPDMVRQMIGNSSTEDPDASTGMYL